MTQIFKSERSRSPVAAPSSPSKAGPDRRLETLQTQADASPATSRIAQLQAQGAVQRMEEEELQGKFIDPVQRLEDEELQGKFIDPVQRMEDEELQGKFKDPVQRRENGLPPAMANGMEQMSGVSLDGVQVHRNSPKPAQLNAHAYAQGNQIHLASGQDQHLGHEAWHVVQQRQGRVKPTVQLSGIGVNDDAGLEREADVMGAKATQMMKDDRS